jgi:hypothetical protein
MSLIVAVVGLVLGCFAYMFWPERNPFVQADKTRLDYLRERKDVIYENLRDLNFEYLAGKYPEADYAEQRRGLEDEAAQVMAEMDGLSARGMRSGRVKSFEALTSMPKDFYAEARSDPPPQEREGL